MKNTFANFSIVLILLIGISVGTAHGAPLADIQTVDIDNKPHSLANKTPKVLIFLGQECAISRRYIPRLNELFEIATNHGLAFIGVFSDSWSTLEKAKSFQQEYQVNFPLIKDLDETIAKRLQPTAKPEAFVLTANGDIAYQGRIDDRFFALGRLRQVFSQHDLLNAITAVSNGELPMISNTRTIGCFYGSWEKNR